MKKVIFCIADLYTGGAEQQVSYLANEFSYKFKVIIICFNDLNIDHLNSNIKIIKIDKLSIFKFNSYKLAFNLLSLMKNNCVISCSTTFDILCGFLNILTNFDWWIRESNSSEARKNSFKDKIRTLLGQNANGIIANSKSGYSYWKLANKNCNLIKNGYPINTLKLKNNKKSDYAVIASRMQPHKRVILSIKLFKKIKKEGLVKNLIILGDGPMKETINSYTKKSIYSDSIKVIGFVNHKLLLKKLRNAKFLISMSLYEGSPNLAIEALANNCELFLSDTSSHNDFIPREIVNYVSDDLTYKKSKKFNKLEIEKFLSDFEIKLIYRNYKKVMGL